MALKLQHFGDCVAFGFDPDTGARGFLTRITNGTGAASVLGTLVANCPSVDNVFCLEANEFDTIGIVAEAGIANGAQTWVWKNGSRCQVLFKDGESATRGYVAISADTDGRGENIAVPSTSPAAAEHFKEIGHVAESKTAGTNVLVLCDLHFN